jgi:stage IV sporulation protein FB
MLYNQRYSMISIPGKIPLRIFPFFWLLALFIGWMNSFTDTASVGSALIKTGVWVIIITISVIVHEYGHALSALAFGQSAKIDLVGFGGETSRRGPKLKLWQEFVIVICGPLFGLALAFISLLILLKLDNNLPISLWLYALNITFYVNVFWTIVNLLPVQPLDGGRLLGIILEGLFGVKGIKIAHFVSIIFAAVVGLFFFSMHAVIAGSIFLILAFESYRSWKSTRSMREEDQDQGIQDLFKAAENSLNGGREEEAYGKLTEVREKTKSGVFYNLATYYQAIILNERGEFKKAYEMLKPLKNQLDAAAWPLLQKLAYRNHDSDEAIQLGNKLFGETPSYEIAFINALCYAEKNEAKPAVGWLESAVRHGMPHVLAMLSKSEFDDIRKTPIFQEFKKKNSL